MVNKHHQFPKEADKSFHGSSSASFLLGEQDDQIDGPWKSTQKNFKYLWFRICTCVKSVIPACLKRESRDCSDWTPDKNVPGVTAWINSTYLIRRACCALCHCTKHDFHERYLQLSKIRDIA